MSEPSPSKEELDRLLKAAEDGNISDLHYLLEDKKWDVNTRGPDVYPWWNRTLLLITAQSAQLEAFKLLLTKGADIHAKDKDDYAALHCAAIGGDSTIVKELIKSGLDVNAINKDQVTPLHFAAQRGHHEVFQLLLKAGAKLDMVTKDNRTTLHHAAIGGDSAIVKECIKSGLDVNAIDDEQWTPLHFAAQNGHHEVFQLLLKAGAKLDMVDEYNQTTLHHAAIGGDSTIVKECIKSGLDVNAIDKDDNTPLHDASYRGSVEAVKELVNSGANVTMINDHGNTPFEVAVEEEKSGVVWWFVKQRQIDTSQFDEDTQQKIKELVEQEEARQAESQEVTDEEKKAYSLAMKYGEANSSSIRLLVFGPENAGKTCLISTLFDELFQENAATEGADVKIGTIYANNWHQCTREDMADKLHVRYCHSLNVTVKKEGKPLLPRSHSRSQMQMPEVKVEEIKKAKIMKVSSEDEFIAIVWDFAGQIQYLNTHTVFVRKNNLVFIVFKASCNLSHPTQARPGDQNKSAHVPKASQFKVIHYWLQTVTSVCNDDGELQHKSERLPTVVLIATHLDEITGDVEAAKKEIILQLAKELKGKPYAKHLFGNCEGLQVALEKYCIFISNKDRDPSTISQLKNIVSQATTPILQEKHPLVYIKIEEKLLLQKEDVITTSEFHKIAVENGFMAEEDSDELRGALTHFHHKGIILYFPAVETLKELIFLSPQWLEKLISFLVVGHPYKATGDTKDFAYKCLTEDGFLLGTFLAHMLQMFNKRYRFASSEISFEKAVAFLIKFGFIVAVSTKTRLFDSHPEIEIHKENEAFIVPSQLRIAKNDMEKQQNKTDEWSIHFKFMAGFIPPMVYHHMVAACITWSGDRSIVRLTKYEIKIVLSKGQLYHVKLSEESSTIQLDIVLVKSLEGAAECRKEMISFFRSKLNEICAEIIPASAKPIPFVPCPNCGNPHIKYDILIQKKDLYCGTFVPDDWYEGLLTSPGIESTDHCLAHPEVPSTTTDHQDCTDHTSTNTETSKGKPDDTDDSQKFRDNIEKFSPQLLETLPMDDAIFIAKLRSAGLLPGNLKAEIKSLKTSADKADYFLDYVILPNLSVNQTNFHKFLKVMEESGNDTLSTLAKDIKKLN